jgi:hypothetical protein
LDTGADRLLVARQAAAFSSSVCNFLDQQKKGLQKEEEHEQGQGVA